MVTKPAKMKKIFFFFIVCSFFISCKKNCGSKEPPGSQKISGVLHYSDPAVDGAGLIYETDKGENLLFKNEFSDLHTQYLKYKNLLEVHSSLTYENTGTTGCPASMIPDYCAQHPLAIVVVIQLVKQ
jgi:hypothetical protein